MISNSKTPIGRGIIITTGTTAVTRFFGIIINLIIIKLLSPAQLGLFVGVQSMVFIGCGFCDLGLSHSYRQMASRDISFRKVLLGPTLFIQFIALILYFLGLGFYMSQKNQLTTGTLLVAFGALLAQWTTVLNIDLLITRRFKQASFLNLLSISGITLGALLAWIGPSRFMGLAIGYALGMILHALCSVISVGTGSFIFNFTHTNLTQARLSIPFLSSILISQIGLYFGVSYLLATQSSYIAGILAFPLKFYQIMLLLSTATTGVTLPLFHQLAQHNTKKELGAVLGKLIGPIWVVGGCMAGVCILSPQLIVTTIGSAQYAESSGLLQILGLAFLLKSLAIPAGNLLESRNQQWIRVAVQAISTLIIVTSILFLYPKHGVTTVAYAMLAADTSSFLLLWGINMVGMARALPWKEHILGCISLSLSLIFAWLVSTNNIITIIVFLGTYLLLATYLGIWDPLKLIEKIIGKKLICGKTTPNPSH